MVEKEKKDDNEEEEEKKEDTLRYTSIWKVMVNIKETLYSKFEIYTESDLLIYLICI